MIIQAQGRFLFATSWWIVVSGLLYSALNPLHAQVITGTITGLVQDASGAMIAGAQITVTNQDNGSVTKTATNAVGEYNVPELVPGPYTVAIDHPGFSTGVSTDNHVAVDQTLRLDITLQVGAVTSKTEVQPQSPLLSRETSSLGMIVERQQFEDIPLDGRVYQNVASLMPGAVPTGFGDFTENAAAAGAIGPIHVSMNGVEWSATGYLIDGVHNTEPANAYQVVTPPLEAIQEVSVNSNNPSAEFGTYGGGVVSVVIRSGSNTLHGSLFEYLRNEDLNARGFFDVGKVPYHANQFGGSLGGPILRDRWFFFADYQGYRQHDGVTSIMTVPTALQRQGIFTEGSQNIIYNPLTGDPFSENTILPGMINPISAKLVALYPKANTAGLVNNFFFAGAHAENVNQFDVKCDAQITPKNRFFARESYAPRDVSDPIPGSVFFGGDHGGNRNHNAGIGLTTSITSSKVNELRFGISRYKTHMYNADYGIDENEIVGIPNGNLPGVAWGSGVADISIAGWSPFGSGFPYQRYSLTYDLSDNFIWHASRHTLKLGDDLQRLWQTYFNVWSNGSATFDGDLTSNEGAAGTGIGMATFLLGYATSLGQGFYNHEPAQRNEFLGLYFQDDFRASKKLSLNLGMRYDRIPQPVEKWNDESNYDLSTGLMVLATASDRKPGITNFNLGFSPRVGLAYSLNRTTVIRAAYGISYYNANFGANGGSMETNYPFWETWSAVNPNTFIPSLSIGEGFPTVMPPPCTLLRTKLSCHPVMNPMFMTYKDPPWFRCGILVFSTRSQTASW